MDGAPFDGQGWTTVVANGTFQCTSSCFADFPVGSAIAVEFFAITGVFTFSRYELAGWSGPCTPAGDQCRVVLDQDTTITAAVRIHPRLIVHVGFTRDSAGRGGLAADRACDDIYLYPYHDTPWLEWCAFALDIGQSVTITPVPLSNSHVGAWTGACASAGTGPCTLTAESEGYTSATVRFDPNVDARYRLTGLVPLDQTMAMRGGKVVGSIDGAAAAYDVATGDVEKLLANATATAVNRRGDVAGMAQSDSHPFVVYANGTTVELTGIEASHIALSESGILLGSSYKPPSAGRPTFTFDGQSVTWLDAPDFWGRTIDDVAGIGGCIQKTDYPGSGGFFRSSGGLFRNGILAPVSPHACVDLLDTNGLEIGTGGNAESQAVWEGTDQSLWPFVEARDLDPTRTIAGAIDFDGFWPRTLNVPGSYTIGFHAAIYSGGTAQDLNYVADTSGIDSVAHVPIERAIAIDGGRILVTFRNRWSVGVGILERVQPQ